jgi:hypothetical protein
MYKTDSSTYINPKNQEIIDKKFSLSVYKNDVGNSSNNVAINLGKDYIFSAKVYPGNPHAFSISCSDSDYYYPQENNLGIFKYFANCHDNPPVPIVYLPILKKDKATMPGVNVYGGEDKLYAYFFKVVENINIESVKSFYTSWPFANSNNDNSPESSSYKYLPKSSSFSNRSFNAGDTFAMIAYARKTDNNSHDPFVARGWINHLQDCHTKFNKDIICYNCNGIPGNNKTVLQFHFAVRIETDGETNSDCLNPPTIDFELKLIPANFSNKSHNDLMRDNDEY